MFDKKYLVSRIIVLTVLILLAHYTQGYALLLIIPLMIIAMSQRRHNDVLFYFIFLAVIIIGNKNLISITPFFYIFQRIMFLFFAIASTISMSRSNPSIKALLPLLIYIIYMFVPSAFGWNALISYMKLVLFLIYFFAYFSTSSNLLVGNKLDERKVRSIMLAIAIFYIIGSILLIPFPSISQLREDEYVDKLAAGVEVKSLFKGMTRHSQCLGPVVATTLCLLIGDCLLGVRKWSKIYMVLILGSIYLIYLTSSRTAFGAAVIGIMIVLRLFIKDRVISIRWKKRVLNLAFICGIIFSILLLIIPQFRGGVKHFIVKWSNDDAPVEMNVETVIMSRQRLIDEAMYGFKKSPLLGMGFQVDERVSHIETDNFLSIISAPVEKGVWVTAVLEEGGVIGMILFLWFIVATETKMIRQKAYIGASIFGAFIFANLGEFMFFSLSYTGGYIWAMLFLGLILDVLRNKRSKTCNQMSFYSNI